MKYIFSSKLVYTFLSIFLFSVAITAQDFQGKAYYFSKSTMQLGSWGARLSEAQKKQIQANLKNRLEKTYVLTFNKEESIFEEDEKLDAMSGATDSWGKNFSPGNQYKNVKTNSFVQNQEFYGKQFLVKDNLQKIDWRMESETKQIGNYTCFKATASIPTSELNWYNFSWNDIRQSASTEENEEKEIEMTEVVAWYSPQIPVSQGPSEFWGLPGLILEVNIGNTTMLCSKIVMNPEQKTKIEAPEKGKLVAKMEYKEIITGKMKEMRDNRGRSRARR
ncbi:MAG: GLPGLI family protein [Lutibacter sp.]|uniref:GLPGLI family protein n=1 Tax=Lutibacter sp. TaxID=1925666 RepID=UPI00184A07C5|nr:GLPGLI family protein [Lutibacter sp.]MBT8316925.1 GLPGLI family protein [Lutibacter sp.]NNJ57785.1 GLPGLI family protein [Lutibacter sp.]